MATDVSATYNVALDHYSDRQRFVDATAEVATQMWAEVDPDRIADTWANQIPGLTRVVSGAQLGAARQADPYVSAALDAQDLADEAVSAIDPAGFAGAASDGRGLSSLLANPVVVTLMSIQDGLDVARALSMGRANLDMLVRTQVADAGRAADQVSLTTRPKATGYVRVAVGNSCARCLILAGETYEWNTGFKRHPRCDCIHLPTGIAKAGRLVQDPRRIYDRMTDAERTRAGFTKADQLALDEGADIFQIVNARHRPNSLYTAGGRRFTREGTTRRALARSRSGSKVRPTPDQIFRDAAGDRDMALDLLYRHGYLVDDPALVRATLSSGGIGPAGPVPVVTVRPAFAQARTVQDVGYAAEAEAKRLTGRDIRLDFHGQDLDIAREHAEGIVRVLEEFPQAQISVRALPVGNPKAYAQTNMANGELRFNPRFAGDPVLYRNALANDGARGFHLRFETTPAGTGAHEAVHAVHGQFNEIEISRRVSRMIDQQSLAAGMDVVDYIRRELGGYSTKHMRELIAAAGADAILAGAAASPLSRGILQIMRDLHAAGPMRSAAARLAPSVGVDLSKLTVKQLRDVATARGITIAARARKQEILDLLQPSTVDAAVARQAAITQHRAVADALAEVGQLLGDEASTAVLAARAQAIATRTTGDAKKALTGLVRAMRTGDGAKVERAIVLAERKAGLRRLGGAGDVADFDRRAHVPIGDERVAAGAKVRIVRPGYDTVIGDEELRLARAQVEPLTAAEIKDIERRALRAAARERNALIESRAGTARLLAEVDELLAKQAEARVIRQRLDPALIGREQPFAGADPKILDALTKALDAGDVAKLRTAVTSATRKAGLKPIGKAGQKATFDPDTMEPLPGVTIAAGAKVQVVTRGATLTLPDGTTLQLTKAQVTTVGRPKVARTAQTFDTKATMRSEGVTQAQVDHVRQALDSWARKGHSPVPMGLEHRQLERMAELAPVDFDAEFLRFAQDHPILFDRMVQDQNLDAWWTDRIGRRFPRMTLAEAREKATADFRRAVEGKPIVIRRARESRLRQMLQDGRMKTQFETGTSGGALAPDWRARFEEASFGYSRDLDPTQRPVYGFVELRGRVTKAGAQDAVSMYGEIQIVLKPEVRRRATVTVGDSLDMQGAVRPTPLDNPTWESVGAEKVDIEFQESDYVEVQIHGGITLDDIREVVFKGPPQAATVEELERAGVKWRVL